MHGPMQEAREVQHVHRVREHQRRQTAVRIPAVRLVAWLAAQTALVCLRQSRTRFGGNTAVLQTQNDVRFAEAMHAGLSTKLCKLITRRT